MVTLLIILGIFLFVNLVIGLILPPFIVYRILLVRTKKEKWGRKCSETKDAEQVTMFEEGEKWGEQYASYRKEVSIVSDGFKLVAWYFDFGYDKAAIVLPGRSESCLYSCYFAEPYRQMGYNLLLPDIRCHGLSEGKFNNVGYSEWVDVLAWGKFLHDEKKNRSVICHGICIGAASALYALIDNSCPDYIQGLVADGMFTTFRDSFINHLKKGGYPKFPTTLIVMALIKKHSHSDAFNDGPITRISRLNKPILFLYSKEDLFSRPDEAQRLYDACVAPKKIVWFDKGNHSHIRINNREKYDESIRTFLKEYFS
ncbi:MAG: alpha/beta hydrolase [Treponema sp.]|nr:alpha/beta hydrolase [Treponema sp.]